MSFQPAGRRPDSTSFAAGGHEMQNYPAADAAMPPRTAPNTLRDITPYLGLRSRLSQVWINRWTVLLFLVLVRVLVAIAGLTHDLGSAKTEALSACSGVESMGSAMASMPHYLSAGVNELAASGVEKAVHGLMSMLLLTITGIEEIIVFYINMLTSTYMCLITLAVSGSLHVALKVIEEVADFLNSTLKDISNDIGSTVSDFQSGLNKFTGALNSIPKAFGGSDGSIPKVDLSKEQTALTTLQLPSSLDQDLTKMNNSIPTFSDVQNFTDNVIRFPFEEVKKLINDSIKFTFNRSVFPVPQKEELSFCSDNNGISDFFNDLAHIANVARKVFIAVLLILAIAACIPMGLQEIRRWRTMKERAKLVGDNSFDPMDVIYIASRPYTATAGIKAATPFKEPRSQVLMRWVVAYATSTPALLVLCLGITGLISCLCQYVLLKIVEKEVPALANEVGDFASKVINTLNHASEAWANGTNGAITHVNNGINHDIFGWVNTSTTAVNNTLNAFVDETTKVLNETFGRTVLYDPITEVFNCLIGLKIAGIEKGLTWVSDNAQVTFPLLPANTFSLGAAASIAAPATNNGSTSPSPDESFLASPGSQATDKITNAVVKVANHLADSIRTEAIISTCIILLWVLILLMGVARAVYLMIFHQRKVRAEGGGESQQQEHEVIRGPAPAYSPPNPKKSPKSDRERDDPFTDSNVYPHALTTDHDPVGTESYGEVKRKPINRDSTLRMEDGSCMGLGTRRSVYPIIEKGWH